MPKAGNLDCCSARRIGAADIAAVDSLAGIAARHGLAKLEIVANGGLSVRIARHSPLAPRGKARMAEAADDPGLWLNITDLAKLRGRDKAAISRRVAKYENAGLLKSRREGGNKLVNIAEFDRAAGEATDSIRESNGSGGAAPLAPPVAGAPGDPVLAREQARRMAYGADMQKLDLDERLGRIVSTEAVRQAMARAGENLVRVLGQMPGRAEECAAAVAKDGVQGARAFLRGLERIVREELARSLTLGEAEAAEAAGESDFGVAQTQSPAPGDSLVVARLDA